MPQAGSPARHEAPAPRDAERLQLNIVGKSAAAAMRRRGA
jgi:hypothetical protein